MADLKLYDMDRSGNCYKIRLLLSMLSVEYRKIPANTLAGETLSDEFKRLNPRGQIPVLVDGDTLIWDSMAILVYLARRYGTDQWLPSDALGEARVMQWLAVSENELLYGLARARAAEVLGRPFDPERCREDARPGLEAMERRLSESDWLAADCATIADIACYPYVSLANEAKLSLDPYPAVQTWLQRVTTLPGWESMVE